MVRTLKFIALYFQLTRAYNYLPRLTYNYKPEFIYLLLQDRDGLTLDEAKEVIYSSQLFYDKEKPIVYEKFCRAERFRYN